MQDHSGRTAVGSRAGRRAWAFARAIAKGCAAIVALVLVLAHPGPPGAGVAQDRARQPEPAAILLDVEGAIGPATTGYLRQGFEAAAARDAVLVIVRMDTPGGLDSATRDIIR
ncbi:MAG TPA: hypothetical protein VK943_16375, partial [Arenibaculum sp.]|nr:hypothetical protein [Arenibaculum sp.]